jgi:hypothetical protein
MSRCHPAERDFGEGRHGERAVWEALQRTLPNDAELFYSVWLVDDSTELEVDIRRGG